MEQKQHWLERPIHPALPAVTNEVVLFTILILAAIFTRFYDLGARVMSHDESLHTYFSWLLYRGQGYQHSPMMHGPFQFHIIALTYFLFGVSDFTARIPAALFSIATVWLVWYWRRYLGKAGALIAGLLLVISPYMLYYGRYVRNEAFVAFSGVLMLYALLRYLEEGQSKYLYLYTSALMLHFVSKETSYIYAALVLLFLAILFLAQVTRQVWEGHADEYRKFVIALAIGLLLFVAGGGMLIAQRHGGVLSATETASPANPSAATSPLSPTLASGPSPALILVLVGLLALAAAVSFLIHGYGWERIRALRVFDLLMLSGMLVLPLLTAFAIKLLEPWLHATIPTDAASLSTLSARDVFIMGILTVVMFALSAVAGWLWNRSLWWKLALTFWVPFTVLYTTFFTNSSGFFTGVIGSLGYWIVQQGVQRGSQPWYYYLLVQIPIYEFLPALGTLLALGLGLRHLTRQDDSGEEAPLANAETTALLEAQKEQSTSESEASSHQTGEGDSMTFLLFNLLAWWSMGSLVAFTYAGERMPWLTVHITWPMILLTGWAIGYLIDTTDWQALRQRHLFLVLGLMIVFLTSAANALLALLGPLPPFQGKDLAQLQATANFLLPFGVAIASGFGLNTLLRDWNAQHIRRTFALVSFALLAVLTARAAFRAAYIEYDNATEFLVYAHGATPIKEVMAQAEEISRRTTGGMGVAIAYDASAPDTGVSWPFVWYLRDFTNQRSFDIPTRTLRDNVLVIVDEKNFDKIESALGPAYYRLDYIRMWWPMQDYFSLVTPRDPNQPFDQGYACKGILAFFRLFHGQDFSRLCNAILNPQIRAGILDIWLNRDYTRYAQATGHTDLTLATWQPADRMRLYIRKDVVEQIWNYGVPPSTGAQIQDPTEGKIVTLSADRIFDSLGLNGPRSLAFAPDGTFYVADAYNHRVLHLDQNGQILKVIGSASPGCPYPGSPPPNQPAGTFCEPWGVAVAPDGSLFVSDTWNHRIQKFSPEGTFLKTWGYFGQAETADAFYGPRGLATDAQGRVYVVDTGNKRIVIFDSDGNFITQFGSAGVDIGQFDEPVGIALDSEGNVYITDTWNQRVQTFQPKEGGLAYTPLHQWDVYGWFGQSLDNKPFIAVNAQKHVFITDPEGYRVMEFTDQGELIRVWGEYGNSAQAFGLASGIAIDAEGHIWVTDSAFGRILRFTLPEAAGAQPPAAASPTETAP
ncbi:MAG: flippase activity-associated protein Agl23, partial [Anaerolineae bacterium]